MRQIGEKGDCSGKFSDTEQRYSQVEREALAVVLACEKFQLYLLGRHFHLVTDNRAVQLIYTIRSRNHLQSFVVGICG